MFDISFDWPKAKIFCKNNGILSMVLPKLMLLLVMHADIVFPSSIL